MSDYNLDFDSLALAKESERLEKDLLSSMDTKTSSIVMVTYLASGNDSQSIAEVFRTTPKYAEDIIKLVGDCPIGTWISIPSADNPDKVTGMFKITESLCAVKILTN